MSRPATTVDEELLAALRGAGLSDVDGSGLARALYSSDASLYRVLPRAVVRPRDADEIVAALEVCRSLGVPLTARGAGTSIAGNAVGPGVVLDTSRHLNRVRSIDPEAATAAVEPGLVQAALQARALPHGLRFGPDPSTHNRCTVGGMIGNNACGSRALGYGRTSDNVVGLDVVTGSGERLRLGDGAASGVLDDLNKLIASMQPELGDGTYVFVTMPLDGADPDGLGAVMSFRESEGVTMIVPEQAASAAGLVGVFPCRMVTLTVHSALNAVGFLAAVTARLAAAGISVNAVSAFFHDHLFVPVGQAEETVEILCRMAADAKPEG